MVGGGVSLALPSIHFIVEKLVNIKKVAKMNRYNQYYLDFLINLF